MTAVTVAAVAARLSSLDSLYSTLNRVPRTQGYRKIRTPFDKETGVAVRYELGLPLRSL